MRFTAAAAATMAGVAAASWSPDAGSWGGDHGAPAGPPSNGTWGGDSYTTEVVTAFTTYCPAATEVTHGGVTYSVTEATTLTITNCPNGCTVTKPVATAPASTPYSPVTTSEAESSVEVAPTPYSSEAASSPVAPVPVYPTNNGTVPAPAPSGTGSYTSATEGSPIPEQTGNGASTLSAGAAGILAVFGLVAAL